jgi:macrodomain Ter protein organizer (MatP/YcbG family)
MRTKLKLNKMELKQKETIIKTVIRTERKNFFNSYRKHSLKVAVTLSDLI